MKQTDLVSQLDSFFSIEAFDEAEYWKARLSDKDAAVLEQYALPEFRSGVWNGLMLANTDQVERVYLVVFPSQAILDTVIAREVARGAPGALIFAHHLLNVDPNRRSFDLAPEAQLEELREHRISYYLCHAPLDCHAEVSTATAMANMLGLREQVRFAPFFSGLAAVAGTVGKPVSFEAFAARLVKIGDLPALRYDQVRHNGRPVQRVAVVPGAGLMPALTEEAAALGCDTYVTGQWWFYGEGEHADLQRSIARDLLPGLHMNLLGISRYASEAIVLREQMPGWFRDRDVDAEFVPQEDPWA